MKILRLFFLVITASTHLTLAQESSVVDPFKGNSDELISKEFKLYPLESGLIKYSVKDQPLDSISFTFDRFGWRQSTIEKGDKTYYGIKTAIHTRVSKDGTAVFNVNMLDKKGVTFLESEFADLAKYKNPEELLIAQMSRLNAIKIGAETILDKPCDVWGYLSKGKSCKLWVWNSLILKDEGPKNTITAIKIDITSPIDSRLFDQPKDIVWRLPSEN